MNTKTLLSLKQIGKTFSNGTVALQDMSLDVHEGSFVSLLGPSGCGKSTALKIVAGLGNLTTGSMSWPTASVDPLGRPDHEISFVFQEPTLMLWATVFDNVWLPLRLKGVKKKAARAAVEEALEMVGLQDFAASYPRELSGGMKMRVSIARALVTRPKLLLMDEPFAALDEITRSKLNDDLLRLWQKMNWTVIFVTHSVFESAYLSDRIVVMAARPGRVVADIAVDAPYPRDSSEFRSSPTYTNACNSASKALHAAMLSGDHM
ncbi:ABC transporter ATP-binding protein [Falsihalocynthiibacter arcticus]|uniref:Nitrate/sulfonate/bicarbonate ABC transporter ATP-binding protein n=1 Tax=Falsihalocynthiibacter arcticus TaxID=1579316 RepID=A0A126UZ21_9RHOB|nr:ABC transporter ATP-binding protein [Falsihalocynthiibacter arcticus]AML51147.1 nitrate/sulfonate/bicarbonate ABC transporter ATP-binding protein [Falsihalocynthiibacter arcticus]